MAVIRYRRAQDLNFGERAPAFWNCALGGGQIKWSNPCGAGLFSILVFVLFFCWWKCIYFHVACNALYFFYSF